MMMMMKEGDVGLQLQPPLMKERKQRREKIGGNKIMRGPANPK